MGTALLCSCQTSRVMSQSLERMYSWWQWAHGRAGYKRCLSQWVLTCSLICKMLPAGEPSGGGWHSSCGVCQVLRPCLSGSEGNEPQHIWKPLLYPPLAKRCRA